MKKIICLVCFIALAMMSAGAQPLTFAQRVAQASNQGLQNEPKLTTFDLDFRGGTPMDLVQAIEKATGKPLNVIIPSEDADTQLPPLKMNSVVVPRLFIALEAASQKTVAVTMSGFGGPGFGSSYSQQSTEYGFRTSDNPITDTSIWYFYAQKPTMPTVVSIEPICRFFQLQNYLKRGFSVDDITTAIQTGWKMAGISPVPDLNYHKETNLLIAFGKPADLATIQEVLDTLPTSSLSEMQVLEMNIASLQGEVSKLSKQVSASTPNSSEKNSGK